MGAASLLTVFVLFVHGYHPYVEDGGLYVAGINRLLHPDLYPVWSQFVTQHLRFSLFAPLIAGLVRGSGLSLPWVLLAVYCGTVWTTLYAGWMLAARCTQKMAGRYGAISLLACWLTLPIAGTSLLLTDPYLTARSLSTPLVLLALAWASDAISAAHLREQVISSVLCGSAIITAAAVHPLMAGYGLAALLIFFCVSSPRIAVRRWGPFILCGCGLALAAVLQLIAPAESPDYLQIAMTRYYWFPFLWKWYETVGLIAPVVLLFFLGRSGISQGWVNLRNMALVFAGIAMIVAACFSRVGLATHLAARMQPLRSFQLVYEVMILLLGAFLGELWLATRFWRWTFFFVLLGAIMFSVQRATFPASAHLEMPWLTSRNPWVEAFVWIREHTRKDALFALDAKYITSEGEDAQSFRAIAERSVLPDYSKDGGEAADTPELTEDWVRGQKAQTGLEAASDAVRKAALEPFGTSWVILEANSRTALTCPYTNEKVKVCHLE